MRGAGVKVHFGNCNVGDLYSLCIIGILWFWYERAGVSTENLVIFLALLETSSPLTAILCKAHILILQLGLLAHLCKINSFI